MTFRFTPSQKYLVPSKAADTFALLARILLPVDVTPPDEWGRQNRVYPASAGVPGPRNPNLTPYVIPFVRAVFSRQYRRVVMCESAQSGKTDAILDIIGQRLDQRPVPIIYVGPNKQFLLEQFEPRLMALLDEAPSLAAKVARGKRMTKTRKVISGVPLRLAHGGSSTALKSDPAGLCITDEADELLANVKGQGDPIGLITSRGNTYDDFCHAIISTCSRGIKSIEHDDVTGLDFWKVQLGDDVDSTIWKFWQAGTRYHWTWLCPHCKKRFIPRLDCLHYEGKGKELEITVGRARETAVLICPRNGCVIEEPATVMNETGLMVAPGQMLSKDGLSVENDPPPSSTASFWASGLASPFRTYGDCAGEYVEAMQSGDQEKVQTCVNSSFAELWNPPTGDAPEWQTVADCKQPYKMGELPAGVLFLTCGVDVQKRKLVYVVRGWGIRQESWLISCGELHGSGDTRLDDIWIDLYEQVLSTEYSGMPIARAFIDSGFRPDDPGLGDINKVYAFCRQHKSLCRPTKGWDYRQSPISVSHIDVLASGKVAKFSLDLVHLDSNVMKEWVHSRVRWPKEQPGGWHLPFDISEDYCRQIGNESQTKKPGGGFLWVERGGAHDYLDCEAMAYACARMLGLDRIADTAARRAKAPPPPTPVATPSPPVPQRPRMNTYLGDRTQNWFRR